MAGIELYPTGPIEHYFKQISDLQQFKEKKRELTDREIEVLTLVSEGLSNPAIA